MLARSSPRDARSGFLRRPRCSCCASAAGPSRGGRGSSSFGPRGACRRGGRRGVRTRARGRDVLSRSQPKKTSLTSPRRCSATPPRKVAPASRARATIGSTCSGLSLIPGISGAIRIPESIPRRRSSATASSRALGLGVCGSVSRQAFSSSVGTERFTDTRSPASRKRSKISMSRITSGDLVSTETGVSRRQQRLEDLRQHPVPALAPLIRIGVGPQRDQVPLPARPRQLRPHQLRHVDLDHDLPLEVPTGVHVEIGVGLAGEAVVADDAVGDEVFGPGRDVEHLDLLAERLDRDDAELGRRLDRDPVDRALAQIAGSIRRKSRCCSRRPPSRRTLRTPIRFGPSITWEKPRRRRPSTVWSIIVTSALAIRRPRCSFPRRRRSRPGIRGASRARIAATRSGRDPVDAVARVLRIRASSGGGRAAEELEFVGADSCGGQVVDASDRAPRRRSAPAETGGGRRACAQAARRSSCRRGRRRGSSRRDSRVDTPRSPRLAAQVIPSPSACCSSSGTGADPGRASAPVTYFQPRSVRKRWSPLAISSVPSSSVTR